MTSYLHSVLSWKRRILQPKTGCLTVFRLEHEKLESVGHKVNNMERRFLVWTGKYKKIEDVPNFVSQSVMERARNRMRIKISNYMMIATVIGCIAMVYSGKQAAKRGESVQKQNLEWHREINEKKPLNNN